MVEKDVEAQEAKNAIEQDLQTKIDLFLLHWPMLTELLFNSIEGVEEVHQKYTNKDLVALVMDDNKIK